MSPVHVSGQYHHQARDEPPCVEAEEEIVEPALQVLFLKVIDLTGSPPPAPTGGINHHQLNDSLYRYCATLFYP